MNYEFIPSSTGIMARPKVTIPTLDKIPTKIYSPRICDKGHLHLDYYVGPDRFDVPSKLYGKHNQYRKMILRALATRETSIGALLLGMKGNGKTILMHDLANTALDQEHPVFVIENKLPASALRNLYSLVQKECVFIFDEFDKVYSEKEEREGLLAFFSDRSIKRALFLISTNDADRLPNAFMDRTGRFLFRMEYAAIDRSIASEILADTIVSDRHKSILLDYVDQTAQNINTFMDLLSEIQMFGEDTNLDDLFQTLNIPRPTYAVSDFTVQFREDTPLPKGWRVELDRHSADRYQIVLTDGVSRFQGTRLEISKPALGHLATASGETTYTVLGIDKPLNVKVSATSRTVATAAEYREPTLTVGTFVKKPEHAEA